VRERVSEGGSERAREGAREEGSEGAREGGRERLIFRVVYFAWCEQGA
jgi:hypothetical protein